MKRSIYVSAVMAISSMLASVSANAQSTRTWVSGVGDDVNPCSRTAPCKTWAGAISKTAAGGEINAIDPGGFGAVTITKAITLDGGGTFASALASGTNGIIVNAGVNDVVRLRNLSINGAGTGLNGIKVLAAGAVFVENVVIAGFTTAAPNGNGILFEPTGASSLSVTNSSVSNTTNFAILVKPAATGSATAMITRSQFDGNKTGLRVEDRGVMTVVDSVVTDGSAHGFRVVSTSAPAVMNLDRCTAASNAGTGLFVEGAQALARTTACNYNNNATGVQATLGGQILSMGGNMIEGNSVTNGAPTGAILSK